MVWVLKGGTDYNLHYFSWMCARGRFENNASRGKQVDGETLLSGGGCYGNGELLKLLLHPNGISPN